MSYSNNRKTGKLSVDRNDNKIYLELHGRKSYSVSDDLEKLDGTSLTYKIEKVGDKITSITFEVR